MKRIIKKITIGITAFVMCATMIFSTAIPINAAPIPKYKGGFKYKKYKYKYQTISGGVISGNPIIIKLKTRKLKKKPKKGCTKKTVYKRKTISSKTKQIKYTKSKSVVYKIVTKDIYTKITESWPYTTIAVVTYQKQRKQTISRITYSNN